VPASDLAASNRRRKGSAREQVVIEATSALIAERGVDGVRVSDVAERTGMSVGHVSYYFPRKSGLLLRAIERSERAFQADVAERARAIADPWQRLATIIDLAMAEGAGDRGWLLWLEVWAAAGRDRELAARQAALDVDWRGLLADVLRDGVAQGAFADHDADALSLTLTCLMDGLSTRLALGDPDVSVDRARSVVLHLAQAAMSHDGTP
jgi:AcrR family transcriptional regulator